MSEFANQPLTETIAGIDLGTTNSSIAVYHEGKINVLEIDGSPLVPSYVGLSPEQELLVGHPARNQYILYPERTIKSIKRRMGKTEKVVLGERELLPEEVSALILNHLKKQAETITGRPVRNAVITVPAFFNDQQRQATKAAGEIAGMEVVRILNEPTAASLAYDKSVLQEKLNQHSLSVVYDLGGGTFDVSIVRKEGDITEVLASHGDTELGGDDFDREILDLFLTHIREIYDVDLSANKSAMNRLNHAAEAAKIELSSHPYVRVLEEELAVISDKTIHVDLEITRDEYYSRIQSYIDKTEECVHQALEDAGLTPSQIDHVLLVGGSTRTPLVKEVLYEIFEKEPHSELHPDTCVALGAGVLASRIQGLEVEQILVDITPHSFGVRAVVHDSLGMPDGNHYVCLIPRNTPLPVTRSDQFFTMYDDQEGVEVEVFQGEDSDVRNNTKIGTFHIEGLSKVPAGNVVIKKMSLDLNGILTVTAIEKSTGLNKSIKIEDAFQAGRGHDVHHSQSALKDFITAEDAEWKEDAAEEPSVSPSPYGNLPAEISNLFDKLDSIKNTMHPDDRKEAEDLCEKIKQAAEQGEDYNALVGELQELLYFVGA